MRKRNLESKVCEEVYAILLEDGYSEQEIDVQFSDEDIIEEHSTRQWLNGRTTTPGSFALKTECGDMVLEHFDEVYINEAYSDVVERISGPRYAVI